MARQAMIIPMLLLMMGTRVPDGPWILHSNIRGYHSVASAISMCSDDLKTYNEYCAGYRGQYEFTLVREHELLEAWKCSSYPI